VAQDLGRRLPLPSQGDTLTLWEALATLGAVDLTVARVVEPHLDALAILQEAQRHGQVHPRSWERRWETEWRTATLWGVYAAGGPGQLSATPVHADLDTHQLDGTKSWCSLADRASHALVTARDGEQHGLFAIALDDPGVHPEPGASWVSRGLSGVTSTGLEMLRVPAVAIGEPGWYLERPGFAWGGAGVAAVWFGAAVSLARRLHAAAAQRTPDQVARVHLGAIDVALGSARDVLVAAAARADAGCTAEEADLVAQRVRSTVAAAAETVLTHVGHALGPGPLTGEEEHARRVADLTVYLRQHHAERDLDRLGGTVVGGKDGGWQWW
jgi:alkylation response protein AidB-like acyl-CoA dehydrogenase